MSETIEDAYQKHVPIGSKWRHTKGGAYVVTGYCMLEATWKFAICYAPFDAPNDSPRAVPLYPEVPIGRDASEFCDGRFVRMPDHGD
jgi:hypothetical protein